MRFRLSCLPLLVCLAACASNIGAARDKFCDQGSDCESGVCGDDGRCVISCHGDNECPVGFHCEGNLCASGARVDAGGGEDGGSGLDAGSHDVDGGGGEDGGLPFDGGIVAGDGGPDDPTCSERGAVRRCGPSAGTCVQGKQACNGEFWGPCESGIGPTTELCDGRDHDCDGIPNNAPGGCDCQNGDQRPCYNGPVGTEGVGTCHAGVQVCTDGQWGTCTGAVEPIPGDCAHASCTGGPNPGCDCTVSQTRSCYSGSPTQVNVGVCRAGTQTCLAQGAGAAWGACTGERGPEPEQCDGRDHDCNGVPDDPAGGCDCTNGDSRDCYGGPPGTEGVGTCVHGTQSCVGGRWGTCVGSIEPSAGDCLVPSCVGPGVPNPGCDCIIGSQRNCYAGDPATLGVGICHGGSQRCVAQGAGAAWAACIGQQLPEAEQCDGIDHNCNGSVNDRPSGCDCQNDAVRSCYNGPPGTEGVGTCHAGSQTCVDGRWASCVGAVEPQPGNCGVASCTGPGNPNPGCTCIVGTVQNCYDGPSGTNNVGVCHGGQQDCVNVTDGGSTFGACTGERTPETELCDNQDHNCNGVLNDRSGGCVCSSGQSQNCYTGPAGTDGVGTCHHGTQPCVVDGGIGGWGACTGEVKPVQDDCANASCTGPNDPNPGCACINGRTQSCYTGPAGTLGVGICAAGSQTCVSGQWGTCTGQTTPDTADSCVAAGATYNASTKPSDRNCNNVLDRHNPVARPGVFSSSGGPSSITTLTPPAGFYSQSEVPPLVTVTFDSGAIDEDGTTSFTYAWRLVSAPSGNTAGLSGAPSAQPTAISTQQRPTLFAQIVGDYDVAVTVTDPTGCVSVEAKVRLHVRPHQTLLVQLTWGTSVDMDLQLVQGSSAAIFDASACYWAQTSTAWGASLDIDDLAGCNSENITLPTAPASGSTFGIFVHYYCNHRGHRWTFSGDTTAVCYETTAANSTVPVTVRVYIDGVQNSVFTHTMPLPGSTPLNISTPWWKPATLSYVGGIWTVTSSGATGTSTAVGCFSDDGDASCVCGPSPDLPNCSDPFCGSAGAGCRAQYNFSQAGALCH